MISMLSVLCVTNETCMVQVLVVKDDRKGKEFSDFSFQEAFKTVVVVKKNGFFENILVKPSKYLLFLTKAEHSED